MHTSFRTFVTLVAVVLFAAATRLYRIDTQSVWFDEGWSAYAAVQPTLWLAFQADLTNPPLYYLLLNISTRFFGDSAFSLRWFSLIVGLLTIPLSYRLGRRLFNERSGLYAALLVASAPLLWWASQEARMYTLLAVLVLGATLVWHTLLRRPSRAAWLALVVCECALLYAHNTGPVAALWLNAATLCAWVVYRDWSRPPVVRWIIVQIAVAVLWLPWLLTQFVKLAEANSAVATSVEPGLSLLLQIGQAFWTGVWAMVGQEALIVAFSGMAFVLWLLLTPWHNVQARWLILHMLLLTAGVVMGLAVLGNELHGRYLVMAAPLLLTPLGAGIARLKQTALRYSFSGVFAFGLIAVVIFAQNPTYQHDDVRGMVRHYAETLTAGDSVLAWSYADRYDLAYYWDRLGVQARRVTLPEGADLRAILPLLPTAGDVALNVWYTQRADFRGMMTCVLGNGTVNLPDTHTVYGMSSLHYHSPSVRLPDLRPLNVAVRDAVGTIAQVSAMGERVSGTADRALCLPVDIHLTQPSSAELKMVIIVRNRLGWEIARADAIFATANQRTTAQLQPGERATAYALLRLPLGTPPGAYDVRLRIYDEARAPSGFDLVSDQHPLAVKDVALGTWRVLPGADWSAVRRQSDLPNHVEIVASDNLRLLAHNLDESTTLYNGDVLPLTLLWRGSDIMPVLTLRADDGSWQIDIPPDDVPRDSWTLDWRTVRVPLDAQTGAAELLLPDGTDIARWRIENRPLLLDPPSVETVVNADIPGVGTLVGYTVEVETVDHTQPLPIMLVWQAGYSTPQADYTVFVQLIAAEGQLIAQSDFAPAQGERPTTGWRAGEYIVDRYTLQFNARAAPGTAGLIVGMYDAQTGDRLRITPNGDDFIAVPGVIEVR